MEATHAALEAIHAAMDKLKDSHCQKISKIFKGKNLNHTTQLRPEP